MWIGADFRAYKHFLRDEYLGSSGDNLLSLYSACGIKKYTSFDSVDRGHRYCGCHGVVYVNRPKKRKVLRYIHAARTREASPKYCGKESCRH